MNIFMWRQGDGAALEAFFARLKERADPPAAAATVETTVRGILADVKERGLAAVIDYNRRFDAPAFAPEQFRVPQEALAEAGARVPAADLDVIARAIDNIYAFHQAQQDRSWFRTLPDGSIMGQSCGPVERAGLYVPGGRGGDTPLISSLLMNAVPALVAGVPQIAVLSPPRPDGSLNDHILAAALKLGLSEIYAAGSAWAVAALAYGAGPLRPVDVIAGPGNIYVATAKKLLIGSVGIDMIAGPSEICVVADQDADPAWIAADMLSQAEHDALAAALCLVTDADLAAACRLELEKQVALLPRRAVAEASLAAYGAIICVDNLDQALVLANRIAPEHLELMIRDPWAALPKVRHAGAIFMGAHSAEALGDYFAGPNHVLPTMGTARFASALSTDTFCKRSSIIAASPAFASRHAADVARLARLEGLEGHARSALLRADADAADTN